MVCVIRESTEESREKLIRRYIKKSNWRCVVSHSLGMNLILDMKNLGFIDRKHQFKQGMFMNDEGKRLYIKQIFPKKSPAPVDVIMQYAHVVTVNGQLKSDPGVILGFDLINQIIYPMVYQNDLLDHTINVYQNGALNQDNAEWLLTYWTAWFEELKAGDYDSLDYGQLKTG